MAELESFSLVDLPHELLVIISSELSARKDFGALLFTSKVFAKIVRLSWSKLSLRAENRITYHQFMTFKGERLSSVVELDISHCNQMSNGLFRQIVSQIPKLRVLKMRGCKRLNRMAVDDLVQLKLTYIDIRDCSTDFNNTYYHQHNALQSLTGIAMDPGYFGRVKLQAENITRLKLNTDILSQFDQLTGQSTVIDVLESYVNLEELHINCGRIMHWDLSMLKKLKILVIASPIFSLKLADPKQMKKLRLQFKTGFNSGQQKDAVLGANTEETMEQLTNIETLFLYGYSDKFKLANYPKLRKFGGGFVISGYVDDVVNHKLLEKIWLGCREADALQILAANDKLTSVKYESAVSEALLEVLSRLRLEELHVVVESDLTFDWSKFRSLKSLTIQMSPTVDKSVLFNQLQSIPKLEEIKAMFHLTEKDEKAQTILPYFEGFTTLKRITIRTPLATQQLIRLESVFFNELFALKQFTFVDVKHQRLISTLKSVDVVPE